MRTEFSGSLTVQDFDPKAWDALTRGRREVRISSTEPIPCPSPWRHPIRWLRWNPFMVKRTTLVIPNCEVRDNGDGTVGLVPHPVGESAEEAFAGWDFLGWGQGVNADPS